MLGTLPKRPPRRQSGTASSMERMWLKTEVAASPASRPPTAAPRWPFALPWPSTAFELTGRRTEPLDELTTNSSPDRQRPPPQSTFGSWPSSAGSPFRWVRLTAAGRWPRWPLLPCGRTSGGRSTRECPTWRWSGSFSLVESSQCSTPPRMWFTTRSLRRFTQSNSN